MHRMFAQKINRKLRPRLRKPPLPLQRNNISIQSPSGDLRLRFLIPMDHFQELSTRRKFITIIDFLLALALATNITGLDFGDCGRCSDKTVLGGLIVTVNSTMLGSETAVEDKTSDTLGTENPAYEGTVFDVVVAQVGGDGAEELEFIGFEDEGLVARFLLLFFFLFTGDGVDFVECCRDFAFSF